MRLNCCDDRIYGPFSMQARLFQVSPNVSINGPRDCTTRRLTQWNFDSRLHSQRFSLPSSRMQTHDELMSTHRQTCKRSLLVVHVHVLSCSSACFDGVVQTVEITYQRGFAKFGTSLTIRCVRLLRPSRVERLDGRQCF